MIGPALGMPSLHRGAPAQGARGFTIASSCSRAASPRGAARRRGAPGCSAGPARGTSFLAAIMYRTRCALGRRHVLRGRVGSDPRGEPRRRAGARGGGWTVLRGPRALPRLADWPWSRPFGTR
jgi:hypothetical protein